MLYLLKRVLRAVRPSRPAPEPATVRRYPKRCEPIGTDEYGDPIYSREDMGRLREILKEGIAVRREAEAKRRRSRRSCGRWPTPPPPKPC